jgi:two-component system OmpR family response regulator
MSNVNFHHLDREQLGMDARQQFGGHDMEYETAPPIRILVVGDDPSMQRTIVNYLNENSMRAVPARGLKEMTRVLAQRGPDLIVFNLRLGHLGMLRQLRLQSDIPVVMIAGDECEEIDRVVALELGADDYMTYPFSLRELLARIRAVLRRCEAGRVVLRREQPCGFCRFGGWELNLRTRFLTDAAGRPVVLTKGEYALLIAFLEAPQRPLGREYLLGASRVHEDVYDRSIDMQVFRLRRKLEADPGAPRVIRTERGVGYAFTLSVERVLRRMPDARAQGQHVLKSAEQTGL